MDLTEIGVEQLRSAKTTLNTTVVQMMDELQEAELPAQRAHGHAQQLQRRVGISDDSGGGSVWCYSVLLSEKVKDSAAVYVAYLCLNIFCLQ